MRPEVAQQRELVAVAVGVRAQGVTVVARDREDLGAGSPEVVERLTHLVELLNNGIALKRRIIEDLRPSSLSNLGLIAALEIQAREFGERSGIEVACALQPVRLKPSVELV